MLLPEHACDTDGQIDKHIKHTHPMDVTPPRSKDTEYIGLEVRIGLKANLQPKQSAESLKKFTVTIGRSKICGGSICETIQPPG